MALRQNDWALGAFCARYCACGRPPHARGPPVFPHLRRSDAGAGAGDRPAGGGAPRDHDASRASTRRSSPTTHEGDFTRVEQALDLLTDALLSHLSYEEWELVEPLARLGFYDGQIRTRA